MRTVRSCVAGRLRRTLFASNARSHRDASWLDPQTEGARIRAFFVDPAHTRQGLGRALLERSETEAIRAGFSALELMATLCGVAVEESCGYVAAVAIDHPLPGGLDIALVPMSKRLRRGPQETRS